MAQVVRGLILILSVIAIAGCGNNSKNRDAKREQDRAAMRMADAERERNELRAQIDQLKANLDKAVTQSRSSASDAASLQSRLKETQDASIKTVADLQAKNEKLSADIKALQEQLSALRDTAAKMSPSSTTQPAMNK